MIGARAFLESLFARGAVRAGIGACLALVLSPGSALACPVCFGATEGRLVEGSTVGILTLFSITLAMLGAFAAFFVSLRRRARGSELASDVARSEPVIEGRS